MWKLCLAATAWAMSKPRALRPAPPVPAAPIFRKSRRVTCGTQFLRGTALAGDYDLAYRSATARVNQESPSPDGGGELAVNPLPRWRGRAGGGRDTGASG